MSSPGREADPIRQVMHLAEDRRRRITELRSDLAGRRFTARSRDHGASVTVDGTGRVQDLRLAGDAFRASRDVGAQVLAALQEARRRAGLQAREGMVSIVGETELIPEVPVVPASDAVGGEPPAAKPPRPRPRRPAEDAAESFENRSYLVDPR